MATKLNEIIDELKKNIMLAEQAILKENEGAFRQAIVDLGEALTYLRDGAQEHQFLENINNQPSKGSIDTQEEEEEKEEEKLVKVFISCRNKFVHNFIYKMYEDDAIPDAIKNYYKFFVTTQLYYNNFKQYLLE